jgi:hypothetical protein
LVLEDLRLVLLRILAETVGYEANSSILALAVEPFGHHVSRDQVHTELAWLAEQNLVSIRQVATVQVAELTPRGMDVAHGKAVVPGVKRPGPGG